MVICSKHNRLLPLGRLPAVVQSEESGNLGRKGLKESFRREDEPWGCFKNLPLAPAVAVQASAECFARMKVFPRHFFTFLLLMTVISHV